MANQKFTAFKVSDAELLDALAVIAPIVPQIAAGAVHLQLSEQGAAFDVPVAQLEASETLRQIREANGALLHRVAVSGGNYSVTVVRGVQHDDVTVGFPDQLQGPTQATTVNFLRAAHKHFRAYRRTAATDEVLGPELAEFYRQREDLLTRLERMHTEVLQENERYRARLEEHSMEERNRLTLELRNTAEQLQNEYERKETALNEREAALAVQVAQLDDRSNTHARREVRQDLKKIVADRTASFHLSKDTVHKRTPIHLLFGALIVVTGALFTLALLGRLALPANAPEWFSAFRVSVVGAALAAAIVFYIRWADHWFRQHADEELRLKRLELDLDRATWVVEMALEWKREKGTEIPWELVGRLSQNLFETTPSGRPRHPSEDLASALIGASSGLSLNIPGLGEARFDRKGIREFKETVGKSSEG